MSFHRIAIAGTVLCMVGWGCERATAPDVPTPVCQDKPFSNEVCVAGGTLIMGHAEMPDGLPGGSPFAPAHKVTLPSYFIDVNPVTNAEYRRCFDAGVCPDECQRNEAAPCQGAFAEAYSMLDANLASYPLATATIEGAESYCRWMGKRLPSEAEWERAARGPRGFDYPWGNSVPDCKALHCDLPSFDPYFAHAPGTYPIDLPTADVSPEGVRGMLTTVRHLLRDQPRLYTADAATNPTGPVEPYKPRAARGNLSFHGAIYGRYNGVSYPLPAWERSFNSVGGFRCARSDGAAVSQLEAAVRLRQKLVAGSKGTFNPLFKRSGGRP